MTTLQGNLQTALQSLAGCSTDLSSCRTSLAGLQGCPTDLSKCQGSLSTCQGSLGTCQGSVAALQGCPADLAACQGTVSSLRADLQTAQAANGTAHAELDECLDDLGRLTGIAEGNATLYQSCTSELASTKFTCSLEKSALQALVAACNK